jgi:hypothetical protein
VAAPVLAQPWNGRVLIDANVAATVTSSTFTDSFTYQHPYSANIPGEEASVETTVKSPTAAMFEGGVLVRVFRNVAAGVAYYQASSTEELEITARIPHPFLLAHHRTVEGSVAARNEQSGIHLNAAYVLPATRSIYVAVSGGPTYFTVRQRLVKSVAVSETYPYDEASFASADLESPSGSGWGFNAGVDVGWMLSRTFGVGGLLRYTKATLSIQPSGRAARDIDVGGMHAGLGARVAF